MTLTKDEKGLIKQVLKQHLKEVRKNENLRYQGIGMLGLEVKYEDFVEGIIKKME